MRDKFCQEDVLLGQTFFAVDSSTFELFEALVGQPLPATDRLRQLLKTKAPWENKHDDFNLCN